MKGGGVIFVFTMPLWCVCFVVGVLLTQTFHIPSVLVMIIAVASFTALRARRSWMSIGLFGMSCGLLRSLFGDILSIPQHTVFTDVRALCDAQFRHYIGEPYRTLVSGILFGGSSGFTPDWKHVFRTTGTMHLIAVSGANVSFVVHWIEWMLRQSTAAPRVRFYIAAALIGSYVLMTGAPASVVRAAIMALIVHVAPLVGRRAYALHALAAAGTIMVMINPTIATDIGFQFSCLATLGLIIFERSQSRFVGVIVETIAATMFVLPLEIFYFRLMSVSALIANIVAAPFIPLLMIGGILVLASSVLLPLVATPIAYCAQLLAHAMMSALAFIARLPGSSANAEASLALVLAWYGALVSYMWYRLRNKCRLV